VDAGNNQGKKKANHCFAQEQWIETIFPADKYSYLPPPQGGVQPFSSSCLPGMFFTEFVCEMST
jgi:hypothetical protein